VAGSSPLSNCLQCKAPFVADPRNLGRQRFCSKPECRAASKRTSQRAWVAQTANAGYFKGPHHVQRVREWRARHPGYWKRSRRAKAPIPEGSPSPGAMQPVEPQPSTALSSPVALQDPSPGALQDPWGAIRPLLVGFFAIQMGTALQEDILRHCDAMAAKGREILRHGAAGLPSLHE
jgi:hypothetical protein